MADSLLKKRSSLSPKWRLLLNTRAGGGALCGPDQWLSRTTNGRQLTAAHEVAGLGEGPSVALTNG